MNRPAPVMQHHMWKFRIVDTSNATTPHAHVDTWVISTTYSLTCNASQPLDALRSWVHIHPLSHMTQSQPLDAHCAATITHVVAMACGNCAEMQIFHIVVVIVISQVAASTSLVLLHLTICLDVVTLKGHGIKNL